jgi:uncharacterized protein (DUF849 family)
MLKVCLNGARRSGVPTTPADYAIDVVRCVTRGANAFHVHPRDNDGRETLDAEAVAAAVRVIRAASQGRPVGVSTREPMEPELSRRLHAIDGWTVLPDFASVNVHEPGADHVARLLGAGGHYFGETVASDGAGGYWSGSTTASAKASTSISPANSAVSSRPARASLTTRIASPAG